MGMGGRRNNHNIVLRCTSFALLQRAIDNERQSARNWEAKYLLLQQQR